MPDRHACPLCDWWRVAEQATVLDPGCPRCGGTLELTAGPPPEPPAPPLAALRDLRGFDTAVALLVVLPLLLAAAKVGWDAAAAPGAAGALVLAALAAYVGLAPATRHG